MSASAKERILVALSGGVDSAVAALQLQQRGVAIEAAYMKNWINEENVIGDCPWMQDIEDARAVAEHLNVPFRVLNFIEDYRERVVKYLVDGYARGLTPNPDVMCNREMKFGVLLDWALEQGFTGVATGHYVRREGRRLLEGVDSDKDQSYFLAMIDDRQRDAACFPIGGLRKSEVRRFAREAGLPNAEKKDSQGICFIGEVKINDFLEHFIADSPGPIVDLQGRVLGEHRGLHRYTLGQRRGIGVPSNADNEFYVVVAKELESNTLVVAFESHRPDALWTREARLHHLNWLSENPPVSEERLRARVRYRDPAVAVRFFASFDGSARLVFEEEQRALAPGQVCAIYRGAELLGGGVFI